MFIRFNCDMSERGRDVKRREREGEREREGGRERGREEKKEDVESLATL